MSCTVTWIKTDKHVYGAIYREHYKEMGVFGTFSDPNGESDIGCGYPRMLTEWGFKGADYPTIKSVATKEDWRPGEDVLKHEYDYEYFIAVVKEDTEP